MEEKEAGNPPPPDVEGGDHEFTHTTSHGSASNLSFDIVDPVEVRLNDLSVSIETGQNIWTSWLPLKMRSPSKTNRKSILTNIDAEIPSGSLTVILGSSGR